MTEGGSISLAGLPRTVREPSRGSANVLPYRMLYGRVPDGVIPAQRVNGRWHVSESVARDFAQALAGGQTGK
jgi:hypothetical protein